MQKIFFEILVQTALTVGLFWTILKLTPKSALMSFTILYQNFKEMDRPFKISKVLQTVLTHTRAMIWKQACI